MQLVCLRVGMAVKCGESTAPANNNSTANAEACAAEAPCRFKIVDSVDEMTDVCLRNSFPAQTSPRGASAPGASAGMATALLQLWMGIKNARILSRGSGEHTVRRLAVVTV